MKEVNLTEFREMLKQYYELAASGREVVRITNRKSPYDDAVLISVRQYDEYQDFERMIKYCDFIIKNFDNGSQPKEIEDEK